ncbi:MAG: hypothetical protein ABR949_10065 [Candidatus Aquilonibacter sp.]|jgi:hypothetical protein
MLWGISGAPINVSLKYAAPIQDVADATSFWPLFLYAIAYRESISGEIAGLWPSALTIVAPDNGRGLCQVTPAPWWSDDMNEAWEKIDWTNPNQNAAYAVMWFLQPAVEYWQPLGNEGTVLIKLVAAEYNAGREKVIAAHAKGDVDLATTNGYAAAVLGIYANLLERGVPS